MNTGEPGSRKDSATQERGAASERRDVQPAGLPDDERVIVGATWGGRLAPPDRTHRRPGGFQAG